MRRECREPFPRHRLQRKPLVSDPSMSGSLIRGGGGNVPDIHAACPTRNFTDFARGPCKANTLLWRHNERDGVPNHRCLDCLLDLCSGAVQRNHLSSASLTFVMGIYRGPVDSPHKGPVTRKLFPFDDVIMKRRFYVILLSCFQYFTQSLLHPSGGDYQHAVIQPWPLHPGLSTWRWDINLLWPGPFY